MDVQYFLIMMCVSSLASVAMAQDDTNDSEDIDNNLGRAAAIPLPASNRPVPRGQHSNIGGGQGHHHSGSSNKEISRALSHLTSDVQVLVTAVQSMVRDLDNLHDVVEKMWEEQQTLVTVLALGSSGGGGGGYGYYGREMWKREAAEEEEAVDEVEVFDQ